MKILGILAASLVFACGGIASALATGPKKVTWQDLAPEPVAIENPFTDLSVDQMRDLRKILRLEQLQAGGKTDPQIQAERRALRDKLERDGLDIEGLFEQRRKIMDHRRSMATRTNEDLVGETVRIPGYLLPLEIRDQKATEFLLVPTVGACIHTPAPPPNQMVHVRYEEGFPVKGLFTPIWVSGRLDAETKLSTVTYSDGQSRVEAGYAINALSVEEYRN